MLRLNLQVPYLPPFGKLDTEMDTSDVVIYSGLESKAFAVAKNDLSFLDAYRLKVGVELRQQHSNKGIIIHSVFDMQPGMKYVTESNDVVYLQEDNIIMFEKRIFDGPQVKRRSRPINIAEDDESESQSPTTVQASNHFHTVIGTAPTDTFLGLTRKPLTIGESKDFSYDSTDPIASSPESHREEASADLFGTTPTSPTFDGIDFLAISRSKAESGESEQLSETLSSSTVPFVKTPLNASVGKLLEVKEIPIKVEQCIPGEVIEQIADGVVLTYLTAGGQTTRREYVGRLIITNYQLMFSTNHLCRLPNTDLDSPIASRKYFDPSSKSDAEFTLGIANRDALSDLHSLSQKTLTVSIPLTCILKQEKIDKSSSRYSMFSSENSYSIDVYPKDFRQSFRLSFLPGTHKRKHFFDAVTKCTTADDITKLFAVQSHASSQTKQDNRWDMYDVEEHRRMGVLDLDSQPNEKTNWRVSSVNSNFAMCYSYPQLLIVPRDVTDADLREIASFRSKGRIPVLAWKHKDSNVVLCRSSQPKTGMRNYRSKADELCLQAILKSSPSDQLFVLDCRPTANAYANMAIGGGYENTANYYNCTLEFLGIANIHSVRDSWHKLRDLIESQLDNSNAIQNSYLSQLEQSHWLEYIASIIAAGNRVSDLIINLKKNVLIHCSDGWDRTPQVCAIAQLMMDPYYRTIQGFCVLLDKEWVKFGHKFAERFAIFDNKESERSPVIVQFLDCVHQLIAQFPFSFEFTDDLLIFLANQCFSARYGTFLLNCEQERNNYDLRHNTKSVWDDVFRRRQQFLNPFYSTSSRLPVVIRASPDVRHLVLWSKYYYQNYSSLSIPRTAETFLELGRTLQKQLHLSERKLESAHFEIEQLKAEISRLKSESSASPKINPLTSPIKPVHVAHLHL